MRRRYFMERQAGKKRWRLDKGRTSKLEVEEGDNGNLCENSKSREEE